MTNDASYRLFLDERFSGMIKLMNANFDNIHDKLDAIEKQTTKTNGRVGVLEVKVDKVEKDLLVHPVNCNQSKEIKTIKDAVNKITIINRERDRADNKSNSKRAISLQTIGTIVAILMLIIGYLNLRREMKKVDDRVFNLGTPVLSNPRGVIVTEDSLRVRFYPKDFMGDTTLKN